MALNLGQMYFRAVLDVSDYKNKMRKLESDNAKSWEKMSSDTSRGSQKIQTSLQDMTVAVTAGSLAADLLGKAFSKMMDTLNSTVSIAHDAARSYQEMNFGLQALVSAELSRASAIQKTNAAGKTQLSYTKSAGDAWAEAAPKAKELLNWVDKLAITTPFKQEDIVNVIRTAEMYGFVSQKYKSITDAQKAGIITTQRLTKATLDYVAANNLGGDTLRRMIFALGQIKARGFLAGEEVRQLANVLPVTAAIAQYLGLTTDQFEELRIKGLIPAEDAIAGLVSFMENQFQGAGERMRNTIAGIEQVFQNLSRIILREGFFGAWETLGPKLSGLLDELTQKANIDKLTANMRDLGSTIGSIVTPAFTGLIGVIGFTIENSDKLVTALKIMGGFMVGSLISSTLPMLLTSFKNLATSFSNLSNWIKGMGRLFNNYTGYMSRTQAATKAFSAAISQISFANLATGVGIAVGALALLADAIKKHNKKIKDMAKNVFDLAENYRMWLDLISGTGYDIKKITKDYYELAKVLELTSEDFIKYADRLQAWKTARSLMESRLTGSYGQVIGQAKKIDEENFQLAVQDEIYRKLAVSQGLLKQSAADLIDLYFQYGKATGSTAPILLEYAKNSDDLTFSQKQLIMAMKEIVKAEEEQVKSSKEATLAQRNEASALKDYINIKNELRNSLQKSNYLYSIGLITESEKIKQSINSVIKTIETLFDMGRTDKIPSLLLVLDSFNKQLDKITEENKLQKVAEESNAAFQEIVDNFSRSVEILQEKSEAGLITAADFQSSMLSEYNATLSELYDNNLENTQFAQDIINSILLENAAKQKAILIESLRDSYVTEEKYKRASIQLENEYSNKKLTTNKKLQSNLNKLTKTFETKRAKYEALISKEKDENRKKYLNNQLQLLITNYNNQRKLLLNQANYDLSKTKKWYDLKTVLQEKHLDKLLNDRKVYIKNLIKTIKISTMSQTKLIFSQASAQIKAITAVGASVAKAQELMRRARAGEDFGPASIAAAIKAAKDQAVALVQNVLGGEEQQALDELNNTYNEFSDNTNTLTDGLDDLNTSLDKTNTSFGDTKTTIEDLNEQLKKTNEWIAWQVENGLISERDAITSQINALQSFIEQAFSGGFLEDAAKGAENLQILKDMLEELGDAQTPVENVTDALKQMEASIKSAFDAVSSISNYSFSEILFGRGMEELRKTQPLLLDLVEWYANLSDLIEAQAPKATVAAKVMEDIMRPVKTLVEGMISFGNYKSIDILPILQDISPNLTSFIKWLDGLYTELKDQIPQAAAVSSSIDTIFKPIKTLVTGLQDLSSYRYSDITKSLEKITPNIKFFISWADNIFSKVNTKLSNASSVMESISKITKPIKTLVEAMESLQNVDVGFIEGSLAKITPNLKFFISWLDQLYNKIGDKFDNAQETAKALSVFSSVKTILSGLSEFTKDYKFINIESVLAKITPQIRFFFAWASEFYNRISDKIPNATETMNAINNVFAPLKTLFAGLDSIYNANKGSLNGIFAYIRPQVVNIFNWLDYLYKDIKQYSENAKKSAEQINVVFSPLKTLFTALDSIYNANKGKLDGIFAHIRPQVVSIFKWLDYLYKDIKQYSENAKKSAKLMGEIGENLDKALKFITNLSTFKLVHDLSDKFDKFNLTWKWILEEFNKTRIKLGDMNYTEMVLFSKYIGNIGENLDKTLKFITNINSFKTVYDLSDKFDKFMEILSNILDNFNNKTNDWIDNIDETNITDFGNALSSLMVGLQASLNIVRDFDFSAPDSDLWDSFQTWVIRSFDGFYLFVNTAHTWWSKGPVIEYTEDKLNLVGLWATTLNTLMTGLQSALNVVKDFSFTEPDSNMWDNFRLWTFKAFDGFYLFVNTAHTWWSKGPVIEYTEDELNLVGTWAGALNTLMSSLQSSLDIVKDFSFTEPDSNMWNNFQIWTFRVFDGFYLFVNTAHTWWSRGPVIEYTEDKLNLVGTWANALNTLMNGLQSALSIVKDFNFTEPDPNIWSNFTDWVNNTFLFFYEWVTTTETDPLSGEEVPVFGEDNLNLVSTFGSALSSLMSGLSSALDFSLNLPKTWKTPDDDTWNPFFTWVNEVFNVFYEYVTNPDNFPQTADSAANFESVSAFANAMNSIFGGLKTALDVMSGLSGLIIPTQSKINVFLGRVKEIISIIKEYTDNNFPTSESSEPMNSFATAMQNVFNGLQGALSFFSDLYGITGSFQDFLSSARNPDSSRDEENDSFAKVLGNVYGAINATLISFGNFVETNKFEWTDAAQNLKEAIDNVFSFLNSALSLFINLNETGMPSTEKIESFLTAVKNLFEGFVNEFGLMPDDIDTAGKGIYENLVSWSGKWSELSTNFGDAGKDIITAFVDKFIDILTNNETKINIKNAVSSFLDWLTDSTGFNNIETLGYNLFTDLIDGFIVAVDNVQSLTSDLNKKIATFIFWLIYKSDGSSMNLVLMREYGIQVGKKLMEGFIVGINSIDITEPIVGVTDAIKDAIRDAFDMHSPSKVMFGFGKQLFTDFGAGILQGKPALDYAFASLGLSTLNTSFNMKAKKQVRFDLYIHGDVDRQMKEELKSFLSNELRRGAW